MHEVIWCLVAVFVTKCACQCFVVYFAGKTRVWNNYGTLCTAYHMQRRWTRLKSTNVHPLTWILFYLFHFIQMCLPAWDVPGSLATDYRALCRSVNIKQLCMQNNCITPPPAEPHPHQSVCFNYLHFSVLPIEYPSIMWDYTHDRLKKLNSSWIKN